MNERTLAVEVEVRIEAAPEDVFPYLVDPALYVRWKGLDAELDARPGGIYRVRMRPDAYVRGEFLVVEPPHRVVFTWGWEGDGELPPGTSRVEVTLRSVEGGTALLLRHTGLGDEDSVNLHRGGWEHYLGRLALVGVGADPGPDALQPL